MNKLNSIKPYNRGSSFSQRFRAPRLHIVSLNVLRLGGKANKAFDIALPTHPTNLLTFPVGQLALGHVASGKHKDRTGPGSQSHYQDIPKILSTAYLKKMDASVSGGRQMASPQQSQNVQNPFRGTFNLSW